MTEVSKDAAELLEIIRECDGAEIPKGSWPEAEELVTAGLIELSGARGPGRLWKRGVLIGEKIT